MSLALMISIAALVGVIVLAALFYIWRRYYVARYDRTYMTQDNRGFRRALEGKVVLWDFDEQVVRGPTAPHIEFVALDPATGARRMVKLMDPRTGAINLRPHYCAPLPFEAITADAHKVIVDARVQFNLNRALLKHVYEIQEFSLAVESRIQSGLFAPKSASADVYGANFICAGRLIDCLGVPGGTALPGSSCNDGDPNTGNDVYGANCICAGQLIDCLGSAGGTALPGSTCDDGDPNSENDVYDSSCICVGTPVSTLCNLGATINGNTNVCAGGVIGVIATGGNQYQWSGPNGYTSTVGGSITRTNATVAMSGTYSVTVTNNDCVDILSIEITIHPLPSAKR